MHHDLGTKLLAEVTIKIYCIFTYACVGYTHLF
jgi:hypothetical protein